MAKKTARKRRIQDRNNRIRTAPGDISVGLARASIYEAYHTDRYLADDVDVRAIVVAGGGCTAVLAIADLCYLWQSSCLRIREKVARALDVPRDHVGIFTTQNHSADFDAGDEKRLYAEKIDAAFVDCAREAMTKAQPVEIARVALPAPHLAICDRFSLEGLGGFSVYYGYRVENGRADASHVVKKVLSSLHQGVPLQIRAHEVTDGGPGDFQVLPAPVPVPEPLWARPADDNLLQALFFRTPDGEPVGSLLRFAIHPIAANHVNMDWQSGDYPAYARRRLEAEFGGTAMFLTGPCGDQYPLVGRKTLELARELGDTVADVALGGLADADWERGGPVAAASPEVNLQVRKDYPACVEAAREEQSAVEARIKELAGNAAALAEVKRLSDRYELLNYMTSGLFYEYSGLRPEEWPAGALRHPLFGMRIGRSVIAGLPGEPFGAFSAQLRGNTLEDDLIVVEEANAWTSYYPPTAEWALGGYEPDMDVFESDCYGVLLDSAGRMVADLMQAEAGS